MSEITEQEIEQISKDIDEQGLTYVQLKDELLDHICCEIEEAMEQGMMFNDAYRKVKEEMGRKRIRQIQHETLSLINKKYRRMKRLMYGLGIAAPIIIVAASIFKFNHWMGGGLLMTIGLLLVGIGFLPVFVMTRIRDTRNLNESLPMGLYITGMIAGMFSIIGAMFKIQHWPGASVLMTLGLAMLGLVFLPMFAVVKIKEAEKKNELADKKLLIGGVIAGALIIAGTLFKIMHWPGAGYVIMISWTIVAVIFLPFLVLHQLKQPANRLNNFMGFLLVTTAVAIFIMALVRSQPRVPQSGLLGPEMNFSYNAMFYAHQSAEILKSLEAYNNQEVIKATQELSEKADELCNYAQSVKEKAYSKSRDEGIKKNENGLLDMKEMIYSRNYWVNEIIVKEDDYKFYFMLEDFRKLTLSIASEQSLKDFITAQLKYEVIVFNKDFEDKENWAMTYFQGPYLLSSTILSSFESSVRLIEYNLLSNFIHDVSMMEDRNPQY